MGKPTLTRKQRSAELSNGYNVTVTGRHLHVTEAMKAYAQEKLLKLEHLGNQIIDVNVTMDIQKLSHNVDIVMKYGNTLFKSHASTTDMYISIDQAFDKLQAQLKKYKSKQNDHHSKNHPLMQMAETIYRPVSEEAWQSISQIDEAEANGQIEAAAREGLESVFRPHQIVKVDIQPVKMLSDNEAIVQMERTKSHAMVYHDVGSKRVKVIYRRADGDYGIVGTV